MPKFFPSLEQLLASEQVTAAQKNILNFLAEALPESYEVYFKPFFHSIAPQIVLLEQERGVLFLRVEERDLSSYDQVQYVNTGAPKKSILLPFDEDLKGTGYTSYYKKRYWRQREDGSVSISDDSALDAFKEMCTKFIIPDLQSYCCLRPLYEGLIKTAVLHPHMTKEQVYSLYRVKVGNVVLLGQDFLTPTGMEEVLDQLNLAPNSPANPLFTEALPPFTEGHLYQCFVKALRHDVEQEAPLGTVHLSAKQKRIAKSRAGRKIKVKGISGSGKTMALAQLAIQAYARTHQPVVILMYNISLINHIRGLLQSLDPDYAYDKYNISHLHGFLKGEGDIRHIVNCEETDFTVTPEHQRPVILVDEVQDMGTTLVKIIHQYLQEEGELVFFGDEKQHIYNRDMDLVKGKKLAYTGLGGSWTKLDKVYRSMNKLTLLMKSFQDKYLAQDYELDEPQMEGQDLFNTDYDYLYYQVQQPQAKEQEICALIDSYVQAHHLRYEDTAILGNMVANLRSLEYYLRQQKHLPTSTTFESAEEYLALTSKYQDSGKRPDDGMRKHFVDDLRSIRRSRKQNFLVNSSLVNLATIHSFKGLEKKTVFLLLSSTTGEGNQDIKPELVYTGLTRAKTNLVVINLEPNPYSSFFQAAEKEVASL